MFLIISCFNQKLKKLIADLGETIFQKISRAKTFQREDSETTESAHSP
jgi:hypothetical protein